MHERMTHLHVERSIQDRTGQGIMGEYITADTQVSSMSKSHTKVGRGRCILFPPGPNLASPAPVEVVKDALPLLTNILIFQRCTNSLYTTNCASITAVVSRVAIFILVPHCGNSLSMGG